VVHAHIVKLACELPEAARRSLSLWCCSEIARTLVRDGIVSRISAESVRRILSSQKLKPWRVHHWLSADIARDACFAAKIDALCALYTRPFGDNERVLCLDEKTSVQPRRRTAPTRPARPANTPVRLEHEYVRAGALNVLAAFDTRTGEVIEICRRRKRQLEFIELLEAIDASTPMDITTIHIVCDNVRTHHGKLVRAWLEKHPRFRFSFTPVHCSWLNQVEQWFSIFQRKRLVAANFDDLDALERAIHDFVAQWNHARHPFRWTERSFDKIRAKLATTSVIPLPIAA
jgi:transposase